MGSILPRRPLWARRLLENLRREPGGDCAAIADGIPALYWLFAGSRTRDARQPIQLSLSTIALGPSATASRRSCYPAVHVDVTKHRRAFRITP